MSQQFRLKVEPGQEPDEILTVTLRRAYLSDDMFAVALSDGRKILVNLEKDEVTAFGFNTVNHG